MSEDTFKQWRSYLLCRLCKAQGPQAVRGPDGHGLIETEASSRPMHCVNFPRSQEDLSETGGKSETEGNESLPQGVDAPA